MFYVVSATSTYCCSSISMLLYYHAYCVAALSLWGRLSGRVDDGQMC